MFIYNTFNYATKNLTHLPTLGLSHWYHNYFAIIFVIGLAVHTGIHSYTVVNVCVSEIKAKSLIVCNSLCLKGKIYYSFHLYSFIGKNHHMKNLKWVGRSLPTKNSLFVRVQKLINLRTAASCTYFAHKNTQSNSFSHCVSKDWKTYWILIRCSNIHLHKYVCIYIQYL